MANLQQYILDKLKDFQRKASSGIEALTTPLPPPVNVLKNYTPQNQRQQQAYDQAQPYIQQAQQQYEKPSVQLPNLAANTFQDINNYFQPTQNVRFRDFARELPGAGAQIGKDILQSSARYTGGFGLGVGRELLKPLGSEKFIPETIDTSNSPLGQFVFGGKPVPLTKTGIASQTLQDLGINQETSQRVAQSNLGTPIALAGVAMNVLGNGKGASKFANIIAKETDVAKIASKLKGLGLADNVVREISPTLAKTSKASDVKAILRNVTSDMVNPRIGQNTAVLDSGLGTAQSEAPALLEQAATKNLPIAPKSVDVNGSLSTGIPSPQEVASAIEGKINDFMIEVAGYSTNTPEITGKGANIYTRTLRNAQGRLGTSLEQALGSSNPLIRNATAIMQDFFRGISMSPGRQAASADLRGGLAVSNQRAYDVMTALYDSLKGNGKSLERINAVLHPELAKTKVSFNDLNATEKQVYGLIRKGLDLVHDISYASGAISPETYKANLGKYTPRLYQPFELPEEVSKWVNSSTRKIQNDLYKSKTDINAWKTENALNDPVYALGKRLSQVQSNQAIRGYIDYLATQPQLVSDVEKAGFTKLSDSPLYGPLAGKYVLNSAAEELKGSFFANQALQNLYDVFRAYDRLSIRQLQKKLLTVFNPTTNVGNIVSDNVFGFMVGVDPLTLNKNIYKLARNKTELKTISDYLMRKGIIGTDITRTDFTSKIGNIDSLAQTKGVVKGLKALPDKVTQFYSGTDDMYKAGAFKALLEKGYSIDEATKLVGDAFQNYASVGKFYDLWAKTPIFGKAFIKFQGDLMRIIKNAAVNRPLHLITFLGTLYGIAQLSSKLSGETPENKKARETRFGAPTIPGLNIPLTWQTPWGEINVARYISPFYANNAGGDNTPLGIAGKVLPGVPDLNFTKGGGLDIQKTIAKSAGDPLLGPLTQLGVNADFRGKPILDPNENKYQPSTLTPGEKTLNGATWLARAYTPPVPNSLINIGSAIQGKPDQYGSVRSVPQAIARAAGIKVQTYGPEQVKQQQQKDLEFQNSANKSVQKQINQVKKEQLQGKITAEQAANRINYLQQQIVPLDGITPEVGNIVSYLDKNGSLVNVNVQKVIDMKDGTNYEKQLKQQEAFKLVKPLLESGKSDQEIANLLNQVGISKQDADYYMIAKQSSDAKIAYISDQLQNVPPDQLIPTLEGFRKEVGGASILTTTGINTLYQEGVITYAEKKYLSSLSYNKKTKKLKVKKTSPKKPKKPKKVSISLGKVPRISVSFQKPRKPRYRKLKAVTFKPVKISIPKQNKVKLPTIQDYKNILKVAK